MAASVQCRLDERSLMEEKDDDLSLFLEMSNSDKENNNLIVLQNSGEFDNLSLESESENYLTSMMHSQKLPVDETDYDWLLTPPGTPVFPLLEIEGQKSLMSQTGISSAHPTAPQSRPANPSTEPTSRTNVASRHPASSNFVKSSSAAIRKPSPSRGPTSTTALRPATPTARPTLPSTTKPLRSSTPTSQATLVSTKPIAAPKRSSTPTKSSARFSTPTARPAGLNASNPKSRSSTPTHRPSIPSSLPSTSGNTVRSSSVTKSRATATTLKNQNPVSSRGPSPSAKSRPSNEAPLKSKTSLPERPASTSKERPGTTSVRLSSIETNSKGGKQKRNSCSPARRQISNGCANNNGGKSGVVRNQGYSNSSDDVNPVLMGTKMVERVVNMRKLAPPKQDDQLSNQNNSLGKSSLSQDNSGFGRTLSKKSFDMALRHMDIRRSMPGNLRAMMANVPASSMYSIRSESTRTISASDSPLATSSTASSEQSGSNNCGYVSGSEVEDNDLGSDNGHLFPTDQ